MTRPFKSYKSLFNFLEPFESQNLAPGQSTFRTSAHYAGACLFPIHNLICLHNLITARGGGTRHDEGFAISTPRLRNVIKKPSHSQGYCSPAERLETTSSKFGCIENCKGKQRIFCPVPFPSSPHSIHTVCLLCAELMIHSLKDYQVTTSSHLHRTVYKHKYLILKVKFAFFTQGLAFCAPQRSSSYKSSSYLPPSWL